MIKRDVMSEGLSSHEMAMALVKASISMGWPLFDRDAYEVSAAMRAGADEIEAMRLSIASRWRYNPETGKTEFSSRL